MSRESKKAHIKERIKLVRSLEKEWRTNWEALRSLGYIVLDKPIRDGWYRTFKLRADITRTKQAQIYQEVLDAVLKEIWGREKKYADKRWDKYFKKRFVLYNLYSRPGVKMLDKEEYAPLSSKAKKCFMPIKRRRYGSYSTYYSCLLPRYYFQVDYRRAYITKIPIISPELESRNEEIAYQLEQTSLRKYAQSGRSYRWWDTTNKSKRRKIKMDLSLRKYDEVGADLCVRPWWDFDVVQ